MPLDKNRNSIAREVGTKCRKLVWLLAFPALGTSICKRPESILSTRHISVL